MTNTLATRAFFAVLGLAATLMHVSATTSAHAQIARSDRWVLLKTHALDITNGNADIDLTTTKGAYKAVRLRALRHRVVLSQVDVFYSNDDSHIEKRRINLKRKLRSRPIGLSRKERFLDGVSLTFEPLEDGNRKPRIQIWGLQSRKGRIAKRPQPPTDEKTAELSDESGVAETTAARIEVLLPKAAASITSAASESSDVLLAAEHIGFATDTQVIPVGAKVGKFRRIRLHVVDNDIVLNSLEVRYGDGGADTRDINAKIRRNQTTDWFELAGDRFVREIRLRYETRPNFRGQARIEAFGEFSDGWYGPAGEARNFNSGWVLLGAQAAGFVGFDIDAIPVTSNEGNFEKLEVRVRDRAITLNEVRVVYGNGKVDIIPIKTRVQAGKSYGPIKIARNNRRITQIEARYRSRFLDRDARHKGSAIVEFWAKD